MQWTNLNQTLRRDSFPFRKYTTPLNGSLSMGVNYYSNYLASFITCRWLSASIWLNRLIKKLITKATRAAAHGMAEGESCASMPEQPPWSDVRPHVTSFPAVSNKINQKYSWELSICTKEHGNVDSDFPPPVTCREGIRVPPSHACPGDKGPHPMPPGSPSHI